MSEAYRIWMEGRSHWFEICRPHVHNAISADVMVGLESVLSAVESDPRATGLAIVSQGSSAFAAGGDLKEFRHLTTREAAEAMSRRMSDILLRFETLPVPVVCAIEGHAFGGGVEMTLACDLRYIAPGSRMGLTQQRFALMPGWGGTTRLAERLGRGRAMELLYGSVVLEASDAVTAGLADVCTPAPRQAAATWLASLEAVDPTVIHGVKQSLRPARTELELRQLEQERSCFLDCWMSDAHFAAVEAFFAARQAGQPD